MSRQRVVILGGGMGGLAAAWELSAGDWRRHLESITVYQRGWRLGGKGASSRGPHGRIEEHGLHVLLGYYDATFRVLRQVYGELDRPRTDPGCPIRTWEDAFAPTGDVGLADGHGGVWSHFVTRFSGNGLIPGEPGAEDRPLRPLDVAVRSMRLLVDFHRSLAPAGDGGSIDLSASPRPRTTTTSASAGLRALIRGGGLTALAALLESLERAAEISGRAVVSAPAARSLDSMLRSWRDGIRDGVLADREARRTWQLIDLVVANVRGMAADGLLSGSGYERIDHLDYREWLASHGAAAETVDSPIVRGMYDLVFAYQGGDRSRPRFAAGLGLELAGRMLFDFKGSIFWRMQAGMGDVVFAPLYQALLERGVEFRFFHRLDALRLDGRSIASIELTRQADPADGSIGYDPLLRLGGLPCWPDRPDATQLDTDPGEDSESYWWEGGTGSVRLVAGEDFDVAVLAVSLGMVPHVAADLVASLPAWRRMVEGVATVATRSAQLWFDRDEAALLE
ncbi:MAG: amine oxidase, partial [Actinobacteria bacterium]